jgi:DEAD/DEAH box helicase domain-containing protein
MAWPVEIDQKEDNNHALVKGQKAVPDRILPKQVSYAGSQAAQSAEYAHLPQDSIPVHVVEALSQGRDLYDHQVKAVQAALQGQHVSLTTGTGSGKSLAFLLPVVSTLIQGDKAALLLFPTKALAQDQLTKLTALAARLDDPQTLRPATLDGDTPHSQRRAIAQTANLILTNPDTLHASILPNWEKSYQSLLARLSFCVVDEAHTYDGIFGAHVALILARLRRLCAVARQKEDTPPNHTLQFIAASATLPWPELHVRKLCPIGEHEPVAVISRDTSPRAAKHFFVWNPPLMSALGIASRSVTLPKGKKNYTGKGNTNRSSTTAATQTKHAGDEESGSLHGEIEPRHNRQCHEPEWRRRHSADETALLLARAVSQGVRCMAFAKTRNLVEWIYERTLAALKSDTRTAHLVTKVDSYRGGYTKKERRKIEERLFRNELVGVVGTNALELGIDVGGIDLTLHCGYPSSYASLLQQAGRAGRGVSQSTSCAVVIAFNSPSEQFLWRFPSTLLAKGVTPTDTIPLTINTIQSHLLCAAAEFPLTGSHPADLLVTESSNPEEVATFSEEENPSMCDWDLFGGKKLYEAGVQGLKAAGSCTTDVVSLPHIPDLPIVKAHPLMKKAWSLVSIRSIEAVNYSIVDLSHPGQGGRMDGIYNEDAVLDTLPYSRVFYHAHPGAIITHRGTRYKVMSMTRPPEIFTGPTAQFRKNLQLTAFAKPTSARYSTRPLSRMHITIVKQFESVELMSQLKYQQAEDLTRECEIPATEGAGDGVVAPTGPSVELDDAGGCDASDARVIAKTTGSAAETSGSSSEKGGTEVWDGKEIYVTSFSGCGTITVKRTVHGYKKLSLITRNEMSRSELSLPDLEFDTFGLWFDTEPEALSAVLGFKYGEGVHALSHALLAVAPLFEPGLVRGDLECDHSYYNPTRLVLFDERAGGSGSCERLWKHFFVYENNVLQAALDLLRNCESCNDDEGYEGGCPACLHAPQCLKFNTNLSRSAAIVVGQRMMDRIKLTTLYRANEKAWLENKQLPPSPSRNLTPRRKARRQAMKNAKEMRGARDRQFVVGRPSWPEGGRMPYGHQENG